MAQQFWIGFNDVATEGAFEWASGEAVTYTNWAPNEPNNSGGNQDFGVMNFSHSRQWNDASASARFFGIIEIGESNAPSGSQGNGLKGEYYNNIDFTNQAITRTDANIEFNWGSGSPDPSMGRETFSVRWSRGGLDFNQRFQSAAMQLPTRVLWGNSCPPSTPSRVGSRAERVGAGVEQKRWMGTELEVRQC